MKQQEIVNALNELFKNSMMNIEVFETLKTHLKSEHLLIEMSECLFEFHTHKQSLEGLITLFHGEVASYNMIDYMNEYILKIKQMNLKEDVEVICFALKQMEEQLKILKQFVNDHELEHEHVKKTIAIMHEDYQMIYHKLRKHQILFA